MRARSAGCAVRNADIAVLCLALEQSTALMIGLPNTTHASELVKGEVPNGL
jgi:hypothetical protein